jgi:Tfp pilus assembly protein PilX
MENSRNTRYLLQVILHCQNMRNQHRNSGYALLVTSVLAILTFSMLSVFIFSTNLYKSVANNVLDSGTTFYAAETAMNRRAYAVRKKFVGYERPTGNSPGSDTSTVAEQMSICTTGVGNMGSGDLGCVNQSTDYTSAVVEYDSEGRLVERTKGQKNAGVFVNSNDTDNVKYRTYSFVKDITSYNSDGTVDLSRIKDGDYAGLNAQEYKYRVYTSAAKETNLGAGINKDVASQTMLQMDFNSRLIPLFQFAAFYENDLEITSSSNMDLFGPVHTNHNLRLVPGGMLRLQGNVTSVGKIYKALAFTAVHSQVGVPNATIRIMNSGVDLSSANAWTNGSIADEAGSRITASELASNQGYLKESQPSLKLPVASFLDRTGDYYQQGDLKVHFHPLNTDSDPFTKIEKVNAFGMDFSPEMIRSLQQPVLVIPRTHNGETTPLSEYTRLCPKGDRTPGEPATMAEAIPNIAAGIDAAQLASLQANNAAAASARTDLQIALQKAMLKQDTIVSFAETTQAATGSFKKDLEKALPSGGVLGIDKKTLQQTNLNVLAAAAGGCYLPAPLQVLQGANYVERREGGRAMNILQSNIKSLTVWNRDGVYADATGNPLSSANKLFVRKPETAPNVAAVSKGATTCDYDCMGLAPIDQTQGGLVWHFSIEKGKAGFPGYTYDSGDGTTRKGNSSFGFAFTGGNRLPGALTIASDQAIYVQGDYNNPSNVVGDLDAALDGSELGTLDVNREKKPAAFLGDTITVLSNACSDGEQKIDCLRPLTATTSVTPWGSNTNMPIANNTVVRAAFLARTDVSSADGTENSGGLNNYMRMVENWGGGLGAIFKYRGSFVSLGRPQEFSGWYRWGTDIAATAPTNSAGIFYNFPTRDFGFDINFNSQAGLPPLTPRVVYLKQKVFKRDYDRNDRSGTK